ncbi:MAG: glycosyltransferase family 39 protein [Saprospiraceae bacterium]|nr:glycosyltransferase family 39 protein [Saprospiraceae bacterium]
MTSNAPLVRSFPWLVAALLAGLSWSLDFNGLYGQDAHEYLRQSKALFDGWQGLPTPPPGTGDREFARGYPMAGAGLRWLFGDAVLALQLVSWLSAALGSYFFVRLLDLLSPGARAGSRWAFAGLGLVAAPVFFRAGMTAMSDGLGLSLTLAAFFYGLRAMEKKRMADVALAALAAVLAIATRYALAVLLLPLAMALGYELIRTRQRLALAGLLPGGLLGLLLFSGPATNDPLQHSLMQDWSLANLWAKTFHNASGTIRYALPNILYLLYPLAHPAFCLALPGLFFLFKRTDLVLSSKRLLAACSLSYLLLLGGLPHQNLRYLLPAYVLLLLLLFPAWDRLYCYGFLFFPRLTRWVLGVTLAVQVFFCVWFFRPVWLRHEMEKRMAGEISARVSPGHTIYAFDVDVALRSYLPELHFQNLWERRYDNYPAGSFVLFNEKLRPQWEGLPPVLNWEDLQQQYRLEKKVEWPEGWVLWEVEE